MWPRDVSHHVDRRVAAKIGVAASKRNVSIYSGGGSGNGIDSNVQVRKANDSKLIGLRIKVDTVEGRCRQGGCEAAADWGHGSSGRINSEKSAGRTRRSDPVQEPVRRPEIDPQNLFTRIKAGYWNVRGKRTRVVRVEGHQPVGEPIIGVYLVAWTRRVAFRWPRDKAEQHKTDQDRENQK